MRFSPWFYFTSLSLYLSISFYYNAFMAKKLTYSRYIWFIDRAKKGCYPNAQRLVEYFEISLAQAQRDVEYMRYTLDAPLEYNAFKKGYALSDQRF